MAKNTVPDVPKTFHYLSYETLVHLELALEAYGCSNKTLFTTIVAMFWDKKEKEILSRVSQQTFDHIHLKLFKKFRGNIG